ncbi:Protein CBG07092 [Caenorhabditis briggsae]|uniref:Protein CBG07092 n=1 Tax=Caenorhabditis briggsae TaxID=6238 RepID=A8X3Q3_CAEBR|nr:Protein CBG07092 [Caenorhabditis briggsae]CAP27263.1 Protein CBG07092 [Caenorhabditis briggsae]
MRYTSSKLRVRRGYVYEVEITSSISLGLINTGIITTDALSTESGFWKTCKPYLVRLFDGLWSDVTKSCTFMVDPLPDFPVCAQVPNESFLYRSGSGYCMKEKVCGGKVTIEFLKSPDNSSLVYSWTTADTRALTEVGYIKVGNCYGYSKVLNPNKDYTTMMEEDEKNAQGAPTRNFHCIKLAIFCISYMSRYGLKDTATKNRFFQAGPPSIPDICWGSLSLSLSLSLGKLYFFTVYPLKIASTSTLSLINVGWITTEALSSQKGFWKTCKPYMVRLFDGLWSDLSKACTLLVNQPSGFPNCTQDYTGSFLYRSGSGYCMNSKVCGANTEIEFYKNADGSSLLYSWEPADAARFTTLGYTKVGSCYGYGKLANPGSTTTNLENEPPFF